MTGINIFQHADNAMAFLAGETIFEVGTQGDVMYIVLEGEVDILVNNRVLETCGQGSILGEMALIDHRTRSASAVAKTDCKLAPVDQKRFSFLVQQTPYFALEVMQIMAERLRKTDGLIG